MNILFLSDNFPPEGNAPANRLWEHATRWVKAGHAVTVITCAPNFPEGRLYPGYANRWVQTEMMGGIRVVRVKTFITANAGFAKRTLDYLSFMVSSFVAGLFQERPDVVVATSPQFFAACGGWALAAVRRRPFVFELRDLWPASIVAVKAMKKSLIIRLLEKVEMFLYRRATRIVSVTHSFKRELINRGVDGNKIYVVVNGVDLQAYQPRPRAAALAKELGLNDKFVVGYVGTHGLAHALDKVIEAAKLLGQRKDIAFLMVGGGADRARVEALVAEQQLTNVVLLSRQPKERMPEIWSLCNLSVVPLRNAPVFRTVIPSKIFECMGMGLPVLLSLPEGEATEIVGKAGCGVCVPPENPQAMAAAIESLADHPERCLQLGARARLAAPNYSRDVLAASMLDVLKGGILIAENRRECAAPTIACMFLAAVLGATAPRTALADETLSTRITFFFKILTYDAKPPADGRTLRIGFIFPKSAGKKETVNATRALFAEFADTKIRGRRYELVELAYARPEEVGDLIQASSPYAVFVGADVPATDVGAIAATSQRQKFFTFAETPEFVSRGIHAGVEISDQRPRVLINLDAAKLADRAFEISLLGVAHLVH